MQSFILISYLIGFKCNCFKFLLVKQIKSKPTYLVTFVFSFNCIFEILNDPFQTVFNKTSDWPNWAKNSQIKSRISKIEILLNKYCNILIYALADLNNFLYQGFSFLLP
jgi:hypothetical protein